MGDMASHDLEHEILSDLIPPYDWSSTLRSHDLTVPKIL